MGLQYVAVKDLLTFNLGGTVTLPEFSTSLTKTTQPGITTVTNVTVKNDGTKATDEYSSNLTDVRSETQVVKTDWEPMSAAVTGGLVLNLGSGVTLDMLFTNGGTNLGIHTVNIQLQYSN